MEKSKSLLAAIDACADLLEDLNSRRPELSGDTARQGVEQWRNRKIVQAADPLEDEEEKATSTDPDLGALIVELLQTNGIEDVLDILEAEHDTSLTIEEMIDVGGKEAYIEALRKDAKELVGNSISYNQVSSLWNDLGRPALGGINWNSRGVSILVE